MAISFHPFRQQRSQSSRRTRRRSRPNGLNRNVAIGTGSASTEEMGRRFRKRLPARSEMSRPRLLLVWAILMVGMLGLALNLFRLQIWQGKILHERAKAQQTVAISAAIPRRTIVDREGNVLAIDKPVYTLYAHPIQFEQQKETVAVSLSRILGKPLDQILQQLNQADSGIRLVDSLSEDTAKQVRRLEFDGLELIQQQERLYPQQDLFSNIVGYVNVDRQGQSGVEYSQEKELARSLPEMYVSRSGDGSILPIGISKEFAQRDDQQLKLTLDSRLQRATRYALKKQVEKYSAKRGVVIVMDVRDGSILALASAPTFDSNKYYQTDLETLRDWVVTDVYEPGSTFKPVNLAIAIESGAVKPTDVFVDEGAIQIGEWPIQNSDYESAGGRGPLTVTEILEYSSNVGMVHVMQQLSAGVYYGWLERLKLGEETGIDLPFESPGQIKSYKQFTEVRVEPATTAFGQGFSLTPIKLIQLHSMIANGGKMVTPHVVEGLVDGHGRLKWQPDRPKPRQIFSPKTSQAVLKMMEQVVLKGTGKPAQIAGFRIGGKTGTAQKASQYGGYSNARITSFVGILPVEAPRYAILAVVDEPKGDDAYGSTVAAPVVKEVMEALISSERLAPSKPDEVGQEEISQLHPDEVRDPIDFNDQVAPTDPATEDIATAAEDDSVPNLDETVQADSPWAEPAESQP